MSQLITVVNEQNIQIITLNRPEVLNALSRKLLDDLSEIIDELKENHLIQVVIFTGSGERAFCAGADLKERSKMSEEEAWSFVNLIQSTFQKIAQINIPTIAAINAHAFGGGLELALACDVRVVEQNAILGLTECSLGIIPGAGATQRLPAIVGQSRALDLILGAKKIDGNEAYRIGLADYLSTASDKNVLELAKNIARNIAKNAPLAIKAAKEAILYSAHKNLAAGLDFELKSYKKIIKTKDRLEGLAAFKEKRPPQFRGI